LERLPPHLRVTFRVVEERGTGRAATSVVLDESKDLLLLQRKLAARAEAAVRSAVRGAVGAALAEARAAAGAPTPTPEVASPAAVAARRDGAGQGGVAPVPGSVVGEQTGLTTWPAGLPDGGTLPASVSTDVGAGMVVRGFPALVAEPAPKVTGPPRTVGVALRSLADELTPAGRHAAGVRRLLASEAALGTGRITTRWTGTQSLTLAASPYPRTEALVADLQLAAVTSLTTPADEARYDTPPGGPDAAGIRTASAYAEALAFVRRHLEDEVHRVVGHVVAALSASRALEAEVRASSSLALLNTLQDLREHRASLVHDGFV